MLFVRRLGIAARFCGFVRGRLADRWRPSPDLVYGGGRRESRRGGVARRNARGHPGEERPSLPH